MVSMLYKEQMGLGKDDQDDQENSEQNRSPSEKLQESSKFTGTCGKERER
jgi:hypothetical protein